MIDRLTIDKIMDATNIVDVVGEFVTLRKASLMFSRLTAIYIKQSLGKLSDLCGCLVASIGCICGITYIMGGDFDRVCYSVKNMITNLTGMICDGVIKITSGVSTAMLSSLLAMEGRCVSSEERIVDDSVDMSIRNLTSVWAEAICKTDEMVLSIMMTKYIILKIR